MKKNKITTALLAMAGLALVSPFAKAQFATTTYNDGDLLLSIRQVNASSGANSSSSDYLANLGAITDFESGGAYYNVGHAVSLNTVNNSYGTNLGNIAGDIGTGGIFGSNWYTSGNTVYAVVGGFANPGASPQDTLFVTSNGVGAVWTSHSASLQDNVESDIANVANSYSQATTSANTNEGLVQGTGAGTYANNQAGGGLYSANYESFGKTILSPSATQSDEGLVNSVLSLYLVPPTGGGSVQLLGTFSMSSAGGLTFTAVPEPSTYAMLGIAAAFFVVWRMKRNSVVNSSYNLIS